MKAAAPAGSSSWPVLAAIVLLPLVILLAVLAFAWPAARIAPRSLPLGIVSSGPTGAKAASALAQAEPGAFDLTLYASDAAARDAIENREVYGALEFSPGKLTAIIASAASPTVAQVIVQVAGTLAHQSAVHGAPLTVTSVDAVPISPQDPRGLVLSSALLPLTICSAIAAAAVAMAPAARAAGQRLIELVVVSGLGALTAYLAAQGLLGALPGRHLETWASLALTIFAMSSTVAGFIALIGPRGLGLGAVLLVFLGNPFSAATSAPELLPAPVGLVGQLLPPGAGANLLRSTAYFDGHGLGAHLAVLIGWSLFGSLAVVVGHHSFLGYAARHGKGGRASRARLDPGTPFAPVLDGR